MDEKHGGGVTLERCWSLRCDPLGIDLGDTIGITSADPEDADDQGLTLDHLQIPLHPLIHHAATSATPSGCALRLVVEEYRVVCLDAGSTTSSTGYVKFATFTRLPRLAADERTP